MGSIEAINTGSVAFDGGLDIFSTVFNAVESYIVNLLGFTGSVEG